MNKLALSTKLYASFTLQLAFIAGIGAVGFYSVTQVTNQYRRVVEVNVPKEKILVDLRMVQKDVVIAVRTAAGADTPAAVNEQAKALEESGARFEKASEKFESMELSETETKLWNGVKENWKPLMEVSTKIMSLSRSENADDHTKRDQMVKVDFDTARKNVRVPVEALKEFQTKDSEASNQSAQDSGNYSKTLMIISAAMGIFFGLFAAISLTRGINRNLNHITAKLSSNASEVSEAAHKISTSSQDLSSSVTEQAAAIQETSAAIEEINSMIARTAENAQNSQRISEESADAVKEGQGLIQSMVSAINEIDMSNAKVAEEIENSNREIRDIVKVISEIGAKTQVINDIVFQTKLLSFNASVEAARAGEHGKGFAVVAEEVGNLARMSGNAAKEITEMLEGSISKVEGIVTNTTTRVNGLVKTGKSKVEIGIEIAEKCDHTFQEIVMKSTRVSSLVAEISSATQEQAVGVNEVSKAITQLNEATQQSNTVSEASAASAERLNSQSLEMAEVVAELVVIVKGGNANEKSIPDPGTREGETPSAQKNSDYLKAA